MPVGADAKPISTATGRGGATDELSRPPSVGPATAANATPAASAQPSPELRGDSDMQMSLPPPEKQTAASGPKVSYSSCNVNGPYIAMTFDDGPSPELTPKLLDILKARGIKATFFVVGQNAAQYPDILKRMVAEGHEIGNHSWSHPALTKLGADGVAKQIESTNEAIEKATGQKVTVMRPPYGATSQILNHRFADQYGMKVILWSVDPLDWKYRNSARVSSQILQGAHREPSSFRMTSTPPPWRRCRRLLMPCSPRATSLSPSPS